MRTLMFYYRISNNLPREKTVIQIYQYKLSFSKYVFKQNMNFSLPKSIKRNFFSFFFLSLFAMFFSFFLICQAILGGLYLFWEDFISFLRRAISSTWKNLHWILDFPIFLFVFFPHCYLFVYFFNFCFWDGIKNKI